MAPGSWVWMGRPPPSLTRSMPWRWLVCCWRCWQPGTGWTERCPASGLDKGGNVSMIREGLFTALLSTHWALR